MTIDACLPVGYELPEGVIVRKALFEGSHWQILETQDKGHALVAGADLTDRWLAAGLICAGQFLTFDYGPRRFASVWSRESQMLCPIADSRSPGSKAEALAFAQALRDTRLIDHEVPLQDAIYVEKLSRLLPTYSISSRTSDDVVLGFWLTGGTNVSAKSFRRLRQTMSWLGSTHLKEVVDAAGVEAESTMSFEESEEQSLAEPDMIDQPAARSAAAKLSSNQAFDLPGRPELTAFFNEHIVDIVRHQARYAALGIHFPGPFVLHGPPGCGKTFAIEQLTEFLGWPSFEINSASIASPYIHQTSKKISELFDAAIDAAPAVLVIDEMEAFLTDRDYGSGTHHIEEVSEFLRRIPEASKASVLIVAMTNRLEMIDPAILRRGRFDHVLKVDFANELEIRAMMEKLLSALPTAADVSAAPLAAQLIGRPLSDVAFIVREGARLAARAGKDVVDQRDLLAALQSAPAREREGQVKRRIGFV